MWQHLQLRLKRFPLQRMAEHFYYLGSFAVVLLCVCSVDDGMQSLLQYADVD